ncbi:hypothetical protein ES702_02255 [subsurface metagenome]
MRTFDSLIKDLNEEKGTKIVFNIDKFKEVLENPPLFKMLNFRLIMYLCLTIPLNGEIPPPGKIADDLKMRIEEVKEAIIDLKDWGFLEDK